MMDGQGHTGAPGLLLLTRARERELVAVGSRFASDGPHLEHDWLARHEIVESRDAGLTTPPTDTQPSGGPL
jgi:hypothetical protein